ncbi:hypothetical protein J0895_00490 [Phormidium pseudopriestleyi FRX01]|uniref:Uncharacterized protein n=1 Tax=Phormidium pseudopriestleyi FRX01 TaxID=1759528 RepID=A0ABS3FKH6_9CYAN|nr:hypothetical protein [Phormidium pseudopriestleyi]MBO0347609.1 hypothetical protein [Phormidium pseudopriestleyi FRX01]
MAGLNRSTFRRLQQLQQIPSVWEGDRRPMSEPLPIGSSALSDYDLENGGDCIMWVDGSQGMVRSMDVVSPDTGPEAVVRTLLRAMEHPHSPALPGRPQKIVVKDREIQFFLRGVLQDLGISIEYVPDLPLIDELFRGFQDVVDRKPPLLPPQYVESLEEKAYQVWQAGPWECLADHQIISIELEGWDMGTLYACVMGMLGLDYGILLYRSLESLTQFRKRVIANESAERLEEAFLSQDCLFITFESAQEDDEIDLSDLPPSEIKPTFGNLHPLEGMRSILYDEEALLTILALDAFARFFHSVRRKLTKGKFPNLSQCYQIPIPEGGDRPGPEEVAVTVSTMPELAAKLFEMSVSATDDEDDEEDDETLLRDDLVPPNSFLSLGVVPWEILKELEGSASHYQSAPVHASGDGLPIILIQTSRPKAKAMIDTLKKAGGVTGMCFNPGEDPIGGNRFDLGILKTENGDLHLFGEFMEDDPVHVAARKKWDGRCKKTKGYCGLVIAMGLTGASRGNPQQKDMLALFEVRSLSPKDINLGTLQLMPMPF